MERVISTKDFKCYTKLKRIIFDLELADKEYWWLISEIEAYPEKEKYQELIYNEDYLLIKTSDLMKMLEDDDFQWVWAVFLCTHFTLNVCVVFAIEQNFRDRHNLIAFSKYVFNNHR